MARTSVLQRLAAFLLVLYGVLLPLWGGSIIAAGLVGSVLAGEFQGGPRPTSWIDALVQLGLLGLVGILGIACGIGVWTGRAWGRRVGFVYGVLGVALGLWALSAAQSLVNGRDVPLSWRLLCDLVSISPIAFAVTTVALLPSRNHPRR